MNGPIPILLDAPVASPTPYRGAPVYNTGMQSLVGPQGLMSDPGLYRPYFDRHDRPSVTINRGRYTVNKGVRQPIREHVLIRDLVNNGVMMPVFNATTLRKEEWLELDRVVLRAARYRLRAWADLAEANSFGGFNGMSKIALEYEQMADPGEAIVDMNGISDGRADQPLFQLQGLPLPITHCDFWFSARQLGISRNTGTPLDVTVGEAAGRRVAEAVEKTTIGVQTGITYTPQTLSSGYGTTPAVYGYLNFPNRITSTKLTAPTTSGWVPENTQIELNLLLNTLRYHKFYGPFVVYTSPDWDPYLDGDYFVAKSSGAVAPTRTLRERLEAIEGVTAVKRLDMLFISTVDQSAGGPGLENVSTGNPFTVIIAQMTPDVAQAVNGLDITTLQWETKGGMQLNFKVMCLSGDTRIKTRNGDRKIGDLVGQEVEVLNRFNQWEKAKVNSYGTQRLLRVAFQHLSPVYATADHKWWMRDGRRVNTTELKSVPFTGTEDDAKVQSIEDSGRVEEVFCCVVPGSESFTLANGLATSNCIQVPRLRSDFYGNAGILTAVGQASLQSTA